MSPGTIVHVMYVHFMFFEVFRKVAPKLCIFLYNTMDTTGVPQGMIIMHSGVMDTVFHSAIKLSVEVSAVLRSE